MKSYKQYNCFGHPGKVINSNQDNFVVITLQYPNNHIESYGWLGTLSYDSIKCGIMIENAISINKIDEYVKKYKNLKITATHIKSGETHKLTLEQIHRVSYNNETHSYND